MPAYAACRGLIKFNCYAMKLRELSKSLIEIYIAIINSSIMIAKHYSFTVIETVCVTVCKIIHFQSSISENIVYW